MVPGSTGRGALARVFEQDWSDATVKVEPNEKARVEAQEVAV
mgnify:CR=1 FL=1